MQLSVYLAQTIIRLSSMGRIYGSNPEHISSGFEINIHQMLAQHMDLENVSCVLALKTFGHASPNCLHIAAMQNMNTFPCVSFFFGPVFFPPAPVSHGQVQCAAAGSRLTSGVGPPVNRSSSDSSKPSIASASVSPGSCMLAAPQPRTTAPAGAPGPAPAAAGT